MQKKSVAIITSGYFPVPAVLGGAVEALAENLIVQNEKEDRVRFVVFSCYADEALEKARKYRNSSFEFIKIPKVIQIIDKVVYMLAKNILHKKKSMSYRYILQRLFYIDSVSRKLRDNDYDKIVIENHSTLFMTLKKYGNYKKYCGRYYYHLHNIVTNAYGCEKIISNCKSVIGVSNYINGTLKAFLGKKDKNQYCVLKNRIDRNNFCISLTLEEKEKLRAQYGLSLSDIVFLFSGRFNPEKGIRELLLAFNKVQNEDAKLLVVGGYYFGSGMVSPFEKEMFELANGMKDRVKFTGFIPYSKMPEVYAIADAAIIPSVWDDPAPLTVIESLTSGKPLITTVSGGIPEYANEKVSIILERDQNLVSNLADAMNLLLKNADVRKRMEMESMELSQDWTIDRFYSDFCDILGV